MAPASQLRVGKQAVVALGPTVQQNPVDPLEVEELRDRFPNQPVVERRSSQSLFADGACRPVLTWMLL